MTATSLSVQPTQNTWNKVIAVGEVVLMFIAILAINLLIFRSPLGPWQQATFKHIYTGHLVFILLPILLLLLTRRSFEVYGLGIKNLHAHWVSAMSCFLPIAIAGSTLGFIPYLTWWGALLEIVINLAALYFVARAFTGRPNPQSGLLTVGLAMAMFAILGFTQGKYPGLGQGVANAVFYIFVGLGEEILYRGYFQSRLNQAFGCPWHFYGVNWGWGVVLTALIFGFTHTLNGVNWVTGEIHLLWGWGAWTVFAGLVLAHIRQKTGSVYPGAIVHALPQAIVYFFANF